jgi:hypothetical protein
LLPTSHRENAAPDPGRSSVGADALQLRWVVSLPLNKGQIVGEMFRGLFGSCSALATGGLVAALFWFVAASLALSIISGIIAFIVTLFSDAMMSSGGVRRGG